MEKKLFTLQVDPELRDLIPPLNSEEYQMLESSITRDGCDTPLVVWNGTIVDGHNRYEICQKHSVPFYVEERDFESKEAAKFWMLEHQLARRNLNGYQRSELALIIEPMLTELAKKSQGSRNDLSNFRQNSVGSSPDTYSDRKMAKMAGVSHDTIRKVRTIKNAADDETKQQLRNGKISIHKAYTDVMNKEHEGETRVCECCGEEKPYSEFRIPSKSKECLPICKECETKAKQAAKEAESAVIRNQDPVVPAPKDTGIVPVGRGAAHVSIGLPDDPALFEHVVHLINTAGQAFIANFETTIAQYRPSMIASDHTDMIHQMIDSLFDQADAILNTHLSNIVKEEM